MARQKREQRDFVREGFARTRTSERAMRSVLSREADDNMVNAGFDRRTAHGINRALSRVRSVATADRLGRLQSRATDARRNRTEIQRRIDRVTGVYPRQSLSGMSDRARRMESAVSAFERAGLLTRPNLKMDGRGSTRQGQPRGGALTNSTHV